MFVNIHNVLTVEGREIWKTPTVCEPRARAAEANMKFTPVTYAKNSKVKSEAEALPFFTVLTLGSLTSR